jgi:hypothetical protein
MRFVSLTLFLAAAVFAQAPSSGPDQQDSSSAEPPAPPQASQVNVVAKATPVVTSGKTATARGETCSIPLLNVTPRNAQSIDRLMILPAPPNSGAFAIRQISPPAPPCPEEHWRSGPAPSPPNPKP